MLCLKIIYILLMQVKKNFLNYLKGKNDSDKGACAATGKGKNDSDKGACADTGNTREEIYAEKVN